MKIWIVKDGENLPIDTAARKFRTGMLVDELVNRGHNVTWWATTFSHFKKKYIYKGDATIKITDRLVLRLLNCGMYKRNFSLARYVHHSRFGSRFLKHAQTEPTPDIVVCSYPVIEAAVASVSYCGNRNDKIPLVIDVRDQWPDTYLEHFPKWAKSFARLLLFWEYRKSKYVFRNSYSLVAMSNSVLNWALQRVGRKETLNTQVFPIGYPEPSHKNETDANFFADFPFLKEKKQCLNLIYAGSFGKTYRFDSLIEAVRIVSLEEGMPFRVILAGQGEAHSTLHKRFDLPCVHFTGWLDDVKLRFLLKQCHVGFIPWASIKGAMPNKVFEYMSHGLSLLCSIEGEFRELMTKEKIGLFFPIDNTKVLVEQIRKLRAEPRLNKIMQYNSIRLFKSRYTENIVYSQFADFVEEVANSKKIL